MERTVDDRDIRPHSFHNGRALGLAIRDLETQTVTVSQVAHELRVIADDQNAGRARFYILVIVTVFAFRFTEELQVPELPRDRAHLVAEFGASCVDEAIATPVFRPAVFRMKFPAVAEGSAARRGLCGGMRGRSPRDQLVYRVPTDAVMAPECPAGGDLSSTDPLEDRVWRDTEHPRGLERRVQQVFTHVLVQGLKR